MKKRIVLFDIARALCVLEIVGFWHMLDYIDCNNLTVRILGEGITGTVLSCFTFISGFFLGGKTKISIKRFYAQRLKRFFIPLFLSSLLFAVAGWFKSVQQFFFTLTGLSCFFSTQPMTLWYFSMIIVFYIITPILLRNTEERKISQIAIRSFIFFLIFILLFYFQHLDKRILYYFPFYILGMLLKQDVILKLIHKTFLVWTSFILWLIMDFSEIRNYFLGMFIMNMLGVFILFYISHYLEHHFYQLNKTFIMIAFSSMFAYLFHREFYLIFELLFIKIFSFESIPIVIAPIMVIMLFISAHYGQKLYDRFVAFLDTKFNLLD